MTKRQMLHDLLSCSKECRIDYFMRLYAPGRDRLFKLTKKQLRRVWLFSYTLIKNKNSK